MTDRELLKLAAKAAGLVVHAKNQAGRDACGAGDVGLWIVNVSTCWNPLTDDGDALRLAVKLELSIVFRNEAVFINNGPGLSFDTLDPAAATRKQIVRAAATIGRAMP